MITPKIITEPAVEPVSLAEAKDHLRVTGTDEDALIDLYLKACRKYVEHRTSRQIAQATLEMTFDHFPADGRILKLPRATPLDSVVFVDFTDNASPAVTTRWDASLYALDTDSEPGGISPIPSESYPSFTPFPVNPIRVQYVAGKEDGFDDDIKIPILLLLGGVYENRESIVVSDFVGMRSVALEYGVEAFLAQQQAEYAF